MSKKILSLLLSAVILVTSLSAFSVTVSAASYAAQLRNAGFPESYIESLTELHNKYPNWTFKPFKTGLNWSTAIAGERKSHSNQIIERGYGSEYYCTCSSCASRSGYPRPASEWAVGYFMDPRNWLDEKHVFQFESTQYNSAHNQSGVEAIISSTWMKNANITYLDGEGNTVTYKDSDGNKVKYSQAILDAAKKSNLSAYYIAGRIVKEVGNSKPTASGVVGSRAPFKGIYNYYSIGASSSGTQGLEWASGFMKATKSTNLYNNSNLTISSGQRMSYITESKNYYYVQLYTRNGSSYSAGKVDWVKKDAVNTQYFTYERPWTNPYKAIVGGAEYISASYSKQYTPYLQKFNVNTDSNSLYGHEYMTNVNAVSIEAVSTYNAYKNAGQLANAKTFYIPVFSNMLDDTSVLPGEWVSSGGKWYYYRGNEKQTGWLKLSNKWYYLNASGVMQTGWVKVSGKWYYFNTSGVMKTGWVKVSGKWYYLNSSGVMQTGWLKLSDKWYYLNTSGAMRTGWLKDNGKSYYFDPAGGDAAKGFRDIDGKRYYFDEAAVMQTGWVKLDGKWHYFGENGVMCIGRVTVDGNEYYLDENGVMQTGWVQSDGIWYYYFAGGKMKKNGWSLINNKYYYFDAEGKMQTGWIESKGKKYYLKASGAMVTGLQKIENKTYYFNANGDMAKGWKTVSGNRYYFGADGAAVTGEQTINNVTYVFNDKGILQQ